tara:strand:- start:8804 stop:10114 length:1311 start_codon:yes stop_codon:yes gene_type:complete
MTAIEEKWEKLITGNRLRQEAPPSKDDEGNHFLSDFYRVVFSSSFRRLQDKTQVNPLASTDFVRKRLTHSFEVAVIGERIARVIAEKLKSRIGDKDYRDKFGKIVATACLLHDIGNPPFGHEGELEIRSWADKHDITFADYRSFDGNAQGFRIAVRLQHHGKEYGMNLTASTLAAMLKYPNLPEFDFSKNPIPKLRKRGKSSVFQSEEHHFERVCEFVGLSEGQRHPLSYIVEAADDIVNRLVDLEDGMKLDYISYDQVKSVLAKHKSEYTTELLKKMEERRSLIDIGSEKDKNIWAYQDFRVNATTLFALECEKVFIENIEKLENGTFDSDLISGGKYCDFYKAIEELENSIFGKPDIVRIEAGGKKAISGLLDIYYNEASANTKLFETLPFYPSLNTDIEVDNEKDIRRIADYVSGMTDRYAINHFQQLSGMSL